MPTYINPNVIIDHSITSAKLAEDISIGNSKMFYGICDTSAATTDKVVICNGFAADDLVEGVMVSTKFNYTNSGAVANLTLAVNDTSAYPIKKIYGTTSGNAGIKDLYQAGELSANAVIPFIFTGSYWLVTGVDMNVNTTYTLNYSIDAGQYKAGNGTYAVTRYSLLMEKPDGTWEKITDTSTKHSTGTSKTVNPNGFLFNRIVYYGSSTTKAGGTLLASNTCYHKAASVDMRYSTNCGDTPGWAVGDYVYLVGTLGADGLFYLDSTAWWTNALPNTDDGKLYIRLGVVLADTNGNPTYTISFLDDRLIFYHDGTSVKIYNTLGNSGGSADSMTSITYADLKALRDSSSLVPGMQYCITDYHTTVSPMIPYARSADHQFDIIVTADSSTVLNENARAAHHAGDTYFAACKLEAWTLQYRLENEKWSRVAGTFIEDDNDGYHMRKLGTVEVDGETYILWDASELTDDYEIVQAVSEDEEVGTELKGYDPETGEILDEGWTSSIASKAEVEGDGQGTILMLKDEYGNQCPYDFKSIQFKRWAVTDSQQGREGLDGKYMGVLNNVPTNISIEDEDDFIWAYTFSSDATGSEDQVDYSLDGTHWVYGNVLAMAPDAMNDLNNIVFYGEYNYSNRFQDNCFNNSFGNFFQNNSFGNNCFQNSFGNDCRFNSFGNYCYNNSFGNSCGGNSFGNDCNNNSFGNDCNNNSFGNSCQNNSFGNGCAYNSFGNNCYNNTFGNYCQTITVFDGVQNCSVTGGSQSAPVKNAQILNGTTGASYQNKLTIAFTANKAYTQVAAKTTAGALKIYNPADLV